MHQNSPVPCKTGGTFLANGACCWVQLCYTINRTARIPGRKWGNDNGRLSGIPAAHPAPALAQGVYHRCSAGASGSAERHRHPVEGAAPGARGYRPESEHHSAAGDHGQHMEHGQLSAGPAAAGTDTGGQHRDRAGFPHGGAAGQCPGGKKLVCTGQLCGRQPDAGLADLRYRSARGAVLRL